jgi:hypothetical protein
MSTLSKRFDSPFYPLYIKHKYGTRDYIGTIMHPAFDNQVYVYYQPNPKRELGHTEFFGFTKMTSDNDRYYIIKLTGEELEQYQWHIAVECAYCSEVITSLGRHDYQTCSCEKAMVDGGSQYIRCSQEAIFLRFNTITMEVKEQTVWVDS